MGLNTTAKAYLRKEIINEVTFRDHHQIAAFLAIIDFMTYQHFHKLLGYVENYSKIKVLRRFRDESRIEKNVEVIMDHFSRESLKTVVKDKMKIKKSLADGYIYALEQIFKKMAAQVKEDFELLNNPYILKYPALFNNLLRLPNDEDRQKEVIEIFLSNTTDVSNANAVFDFYQENKIRLSRLSVLPNQRISIEETRQLSITLNDYFKDEEKTSTLLHNVKRSKFLQSGKNVFFKPGFWGNLAASVVGLFTAGMLAWFITVITPGLTLASPFMLGAITAIATVAVIIFIPLITKTIVSKIVASYNSSRLKKIEKDFYNEKDQYHLLAQRYGLLKADKPTISRNTSPNSNSRKLSLTAHPVLPFAPTAN